MSRTATIKTTFGEVTPDGLRLNLTKLTNRQFLSGEGDLYSLAMFVSRLALVLGDRVQQLPIKDQLQFWSDMTIIGYEDDE